MKILKIIILSFLIANLSYAANSKKIIYLVSDSSIPYWNIMYKGIKQKANEKGYETEIYSAKNIKRIELQNTIHALSQEVDGLIISPINSSTAVTILNFAKKANTPVVVSDIGANSDEYVSFISSDNETGAYEIGKVLVKKMQELSWDKEGTVGIIGIPQKRENGKLRTKGFIRALNEANIKGAGIFQQVDFSYKETYEFTKELIKKNPKLRAIWLQGSDKYKGSLDAINDLGKTGEVLLICFDAEPVFLDLIPKGILVGAAMQQPYLMGQKAVESLDNYIKGKKVSKKQKLEILAISNDNIEKKLPIIKKNVLGIEK